MEIKEKQTFVNRTLDAGLTCVLITETGAMISQGENEDKQRISASLKELKGIRDLIDSAIYQFENSLPNS